MITGWTSKSVYCWTNLYQLFAVKCPIHSPMCYHSCQPSLSDLVHQAPQQTRLKWPRAFWDKTLTAFLGWQKAKNPSDIFWWVIPNMVNHCITCHGTMIMKADLDTPTALIWPFLFDAAVQLCVIIVEWLLLRELTTPDYFLNCWECCHFTRDWSDWLEN